jgi:hypothetical protein
MCSLPIKREERGPSEFEYPKEGVYYIATKYKIFISLISRTAKYMAFFVFLADVRPSSGRKKLSIGATKAPWRAQKVHKMSNQRRSARVS